MCIIAHAPAELAIKDDILQTMWDGNSDGAGFMYAENGVLNVHKGFMTFDSFLEAYKPHEFKNIVVHFRIRTHGKTNEENTHPFVVSPNLAFVHNGTISGYGCNNFSDTWHFNEDIIKTIHNDMPSFLHNDGIVSLIKESIGWSKLVFMNNEGEVNIINKEKGEESSDGIWFSNGSWKPRRRSRTYYQGYSGWQQTTPSTQTCLSKPSSSNPFELTMGDYAVVSNSTTVQCLSDDDVITILEEGTVVKIKWFNQDSSVEVMCLENKKRYKFVSSLFLDKILYEAHCNAPWGHFGKGKKLFVVDFNTTDSKVIDPVLERVYTMPTTRIHITIPSSNETH